jgi:glucosamine--fructose-6-phosphate aminotransferase (isomerizing)
MCGIFGVIVKENSSYNTEFLNKSIKLLSKLSEVRGKDSSGICISDSTKIDVYKGPIRISELINRKIVINPLNDLFNNDKTRYAFGHARLVTNGSQLDDNNNQPVIKDNIIGVHNGIVLNVDELWDENQDIKREFEIDSEIILSLIRSNLNKNNDLETSVSKSLNKIFGTVSIALSFQDINKFILATNNGSLYVIHNNKDILFFASEQYILKKLNTKLKLESIIGEFEISQIKPNYGIKIDLTLFKVEKFNLKNTIKHELEIHNELLPLNINYIKSKKNQNQVVLDINKIHLNKDFEIEKELLLYPIEKIKKLKRCTKCVLPETFPYINFDNDGICNYCLNYRKKNHPKTIDELKKLVEPYKSKDGSPDVLIPLSGGRDSTYVLHIVKKELGLNPIALTYDWGMVTDLARRNIAGICGKLGVENIIVAADVHWKRENIKKNIEAWLKKPDLGMIPIFMAGDKYFFYYANKIKKQNNIKLNIWGVNHLENTDFKTGFAGLAPKFDKKRIYSLSIKNQAKLFGFVGKNLIKSPGYINQSVFDSLGSFAVRYLAPKKDYFHMFDFMFWNEKEIESTIINEYKWETALDTNSTWRIGDGTASFYNYIYTLIVGFSENDTFRSNQIREGIISREEALSFVYDENKPRYNSIKWYLEIIGLNYLETISIINKIERKY